MFDIVFGSENKRSGGISRRDALKVGGLGALGLSLADVLRAEAAASARRSARAQSIILVYLGGGISHHDSFDLKPDAPEEVRGIYRPISTNVPGLPIGNLLPQMARHMGTVSPVRSCAHHNARHGPATNWAMSRRFGSRS